MIKKLVSFLVVLLLAITLAGCGGPPSDIIQNGVQEHLNEKYDSYLGEILDLEITNEYEEESNNETVYVYEYKALVKHHPDILVFFTKKKEMTYTGTIGLVERGNSWYRL